MTHPLIRILLCAALLTCTLQLTGCGGGGGEAATPSTPAPAPSPAPVPEPEPEPTLDHSGLPPINPRVPDNEEYRAGGDATLFNRSSRAFELRPDPIAQDFNLDANFTSGDHFFRTPHPDSGPLLNNNTCQGCHINDGRGSLPPSPDVPFSSMLVKLGLADGSPDPIYGSQLQTFAIQSFSGAGVETGLAQYNGAINGDQLLGEAYSFIEYNEVSGRFDDGTAYSLRQPVTQIRDFSYGPVAATVQFSPRLAPSVFGSGLLDAIPAENIIALADPNDSDNDGISGVVSSPDPNAPERIGRFGYKAQSTSVLQQVVNAYQGDMGLTTSFRLEENCTSEQLACIHSAQQEIREGDTPDVSDLVLAQVEFYNRTLGVPARRGFDPQNQIWEPEVVAGRQQFMTAGCANCHTPRQVTGTAQGSVLGELSLTDLTPDAAPIAMLSNQQIYPYTDLLLHDMGGSCSITRETEAGLSCQTGEECMLVQRCSGLADGLNQSNASGSEWRTPPLWGLGLVQTVNTSATFLHDGRARSIAEAILWHGGEAQASQAAFVAMSATERQQLLRFLRSL